MVTCRIHVLNPLFFFPLAAVIFHYHLLAGADETVMELECQNAGKMSDLCRSCLKAYPEAKNADRIGFATIVVTKCLMNQSIALASNMTSLAATASDNVKTALNNCSNWYTLAAEELDKAGQKLKTGDSDNAESFLTNALNYQEKCRNGIDEFGTWNFPTTVSDEMTKIYGGLYAVAMTFMKM